MFRVMKYIILSALSATAASLELSKLNTFNGNSNAPYEYAKGLMTWKDKLTSQDWWPIQSCKSGFPLMKTRACDGRIDCLDGSDESLEQCRENKCGEDKFRCTYGACIPKSKICNGIYNCADGSDEDKALCISNSCLIPKNTNTTLYYALGCSGCPPGSSVADGTTLHHQCINSTSAVRNIGVICRNGAWTPLVPTCTAGTNPVAVVGESPAPVIGGAPAPATGGTPAPATGGAPAPATGGAPAPAAGGTPDPVAAGAPAPASATGSAPAPAAGAPAPAGA